MTLEELEKLHGLVMVQKAIEQDLAGELDRVGQAQLIEQLRLTAHILDAIDYMIRQAIDKLARENRP